MLRVTLSGGFTPIAGSSFSILDWTTASGAFSAVQLPALGGSLAWDTTQLYTNGVLKVASVVLPGDFDNNGFVDAADYVAWRKADRSQADYDAWRANFGRTINNGGSSMALSSMQAEVPEPAALLLAFAAILVLTMGRVRCRSRRQYPY